MRVGRRHRDWVVADVGDGGGPGDDARMGIDAEPGWQRGREGQRIAGCRSGEVASDIKREALTLVRALVCDGRCRGSAVAYRKMETLTDRLTVRVGRRHGDRIARRNGGDCERAVLFRPSSSVRSKGFDQLIATVLVKYIVLKPIRREQDTTVIK